MLFTRYIRSSFNLPHIKIKDVNMDVIASRKIAGFNFLGLFCNQHRKLRMTVAIMYLISKPLTEKPIKNPLILRKGNYSRMNKLL